MRRLAMYRLARNCSWTSSTDANMPFSSAMGAVAPGTAWPAASLTGSPHAAPRPSGTKPNDTSGTRFGQGERGDEPGERQGRHQVERREEPPVIGHPAEDRHADPPR